MKKIINIVLMAVSLALILGLLVAIGGEPETPRPRRRSGDMNVNLSKEEIPRLMEIIRIWKLVDELELNEGQLIEFLPRFKKLSELKHEYYGDRRRAMTELKKLLEANAPETQLKPAVTKFNDTDTNYYQRYKQLHNTLNANLTVQQQAQFIVFEDKYRSDIRHLIRVLRDMSEPQELQTKPSQPRPLKQQQN